MNSRGIELVNVAPYITEKEKLKDLADKADCPAEEAERIIKQMVNDKNGHKRQPKPPAPEGGISLRAAGRKYGVASQTISRWVKKGYVAVLQRTPNELYVPEKELLALIKHYRTSPGQGKYTIRRKIKKTSD